VPAGAVNLLTGDGDLGQALVEHPDVDKVSFTGSTEVGRAIVHASADSNLKRLSLELGGKAPSIIARDADIDAAVVGCLRGGLLNSGQVWAAYTRLFVDRHWVDEFTHKPAGAAGSLKLGPGLDDETVIGPLGLLGPAVP
jgi:acyl-CoA reductase-like NAD-dependent aldehyde dehydrogenase